MANNRVCEKKDEINRLSRRFCWTSVITDDAVLISIVTGMNRLSFDYFSVSPKFKTVIDQLPETDLASGWNCYGAADLHVTILLTIQYMHNEQQLTATIFTTNILTIDKWCQMFIAFDLLWFAASLLMSVWCAGITS